MAGHDPIGSGPERRGGNDRRGIARAAEDRRWVPFSDPEPPAEAPKRSWKPAKTTVAWTGFVVFVFLLAGGVVAWGSRPHETLRRGSSAATKDTGSSWATLQDVPSQLPSARFAQAPTVVILRDHASDNYYSRASLDSLATEWRTLLRSAGADAREAEPAAVASIAPNVLLIPSSPCLSRESRAAIDATLARGGGVFITGLTGIRGDACATGSFDLLTRLTSAWRFDTLESRRSNYITVPANGPLAADIPAGSRVELVVANHVAARAASRDAYYSDFALNPAPALGRPFEDAAILHAQHGNGRVVYWGFDLNRVVDRSWTKEIIALLARNSVAWAASQPVASVEAWPGGRRAAAVLAQDVEADFANARNALDTLRAAGIRGTYFLVSDFAKQDPDLARDLGVYGEIGTHSDDHTVLGGTPIASQQARLARSRDDLRLLTGRDARGLRPPEEVFDLGTVAAWQKMGGTYVFGSNNARTAAPELLKVGGTRPVVVLGRTVNDDYMVVGRRGVTNPQELSNDFLRAFNKLRVLGGVYVLSYHSTMLSRPQLVHALGTVARSVAADSTVWATTAGELADWWLQRANLRVTSRVTTPGQLEVRVTNGGSTPVEGAVVRIATPWSTTSHVTDGGTELASDRGMLRVLLPAIDPGQTMVVNVAR